MIQGSRSWKRSSSSTAMCDLLLTSQILLAMSRSPPVLFELSPHNLMMEALWQFTHQMVDMKNVLKAEMDDKRNRSCGSESAPIPTKQDARSKLNVGGPVNGSVGHSRKTY